MPNKLGPNGKLRNRNLKPAELKALDESVYGLEEPRAVRIETDFWSRMNLGDGNRWVSRNRAGG